MPNRILREGILTSERVNQLSWEAEVFYRRLMSVVDDYGRFSAHPSILRAALYPLKLDMVRDAHLERSLAAVERARLVRVYEVDGKRYVELCDFRQQARAKTSKFPDPPANAQHLQVVGCALDKHMHSKRVADAPVFGDGDGDDKTPPPPLRGEPCPPGFARFWDSWPTHPRKVAKSQCLAKWRAKGCEEIAEAIVAALEVQKASDAWRKNAGEFIPAPLVWLNQARWEAPSEVQASAHGNGAPSVEQTQALLQAQRDRQSSPQAVQAGVAALKAIRGSA